MPKLPRLPNPEDALNFIDKAGDVVSKGLELIDRTTKKIDRLAGRIDSVGGLTLETPTRATVPQAGGLLPTTVPQTPEENPSEKIATACVVCAIGHFSGAAKLLAEAWRFRDEGITSNQVSDDIAGAIGELNAMERVDMTPERLQKTPEWERALAEESLRESRKLRHRLEGIMSMEEIEKAAADTESYYKKLHRQWYKGRFRNLGAKKAEAIAERVGEK